MTLPEKTYYRMEEVAEEWKCKIDDLLDYAEQELLIISVRPFSVSTINGDKVDEPDNVESAFSPVCLYQKKTAPFPFGLFPVSSFTIKKLRTDLSFYIVQRGLSLFSPYKTSDVDCWEGTFNKKEMFITHEEKERFEKESRGVPQIQKKELAAMPLELSCALRAWQALYRDGGIKSRISHKDQIIEWLREKEPSLSGNAIDRIATVVNERKVGGQLPMD